MSSSVQSRTAKNRDCVGAAHSRVENGESVVAHHSVFVLDFWRLLLRETEACKLLAVKAGTGNPPAVGICPDSVELRHENGSASFDGGLVHTEHE